MRSLGYPDAGRFLTVPQSPRNLPLARVLVTGLLHRAARSAPSSSVGAGSGGLSEPSSRRTSSGATRLLNGPFMTRPSGEGATQDAAGHFIMLTVVNSKERKMATSDLQPKKTEPGWYRDPDDHKQMRYWRGSEWGTSRALRVQHTDPLPQRFLKGGTPGGNMTAGVLLSFFGAVLFGLGMREVDDPDVAVGLFILGGIAWFAGSIALSIGVIARGVQIGLREHHWDWNP